MARRWWIGLVALVGCVDGPRLVAPVPTLEVQTADVALVTLYRPATPPPHRPILWLHAGGWANGTALLASTHAIMRLVAAGYAVASVDYRLSGVATWPAQATDTRAAIRMVRDSATAWGLLADQLGAIGYSAGAHLVAHAAARCDAPAECLQAVVAVSAPVDFLREDAQLAAKGCPSPRADVDGSQEARLLGARPSLSPLTADASPLTYVSGDEPPLMILHGLSDCTVPFAQSGQLAAAWSAVGRPVERYRYAAAHAMLPIIGADSTMARILGFYATHIGGPS